MNPNINDLVITDAESLVPGGASRITFYSAHAALDEPATDQRAHDELVAVATTALRAVAPWFEPYIVSAQVPVYIGVGLFAVPMKGEGEKVVIATINPICAEMQRLAGDDPTKAPPGRPLQLTATA